MSNLKAIADRLKSIMSIQKITKSMKMVSVSKYARAERLLRAVRPFGEGSKMFFEKLVVQPDKKMLLVAITSDRGLCGACHSSVCRNITRYINEKKDTEYQLVCIGDKSRSILNRLFGKSILLVVKDVGRKPPTFLDASMIMEAIIGLGLKDAHWVLYYNKFKNMAQYLPDNIHISNPTVFSEELIAYEEMPEEDLDSYIEFARVSLVYYTMVESACSEQSARMQAMETATKNASDMLNKLRLTYNRSRQASITKELIEIISGAAALKDKE